MINLQTKAKSYGALVANAEEASWSQNPPLHKNLHVERLVADILIRSQKGELHLTIHNKYARASHNYSIVEYLVQAF